MINKLLLTNFKRHETLAIDFSAGLVSVRGANEAGKTTIFQAVAYAFYGARALPSTLEQTVTYGKPVSSLKVTLSFTHVGVEYTITRGKSGAKLEGNGVTAEGQNEVTGFIEKLFGVPAATSTQLMIASQNKLRGSLEGGTSAIDLIEKLSDLDFIDDLINRIQAKLPSGQTKPLETMIANLQNEKQPLWNEEPFLAAITTADTQLQLCQETVKGLEDALSKINVDDAHATVNEASRKTGEADSMRSRRERLQGILQQHRAQPEEARNDHADANELRARKQKQAEELVAWNVYAKFQVIEPLPVLYQMTGAELGVKLREHEAQLGAISGEQTKLKVQRATVAGKLITDEACGLCGKLLQDVPEVVQGNAQVDAQLAVFDNQIAVNDRELDRLTALVQGIRKDLALHATRREAAAKLVGYVDTIDVVPFQVKWKGSAPKSPELVDYDHLIRAAELAASEAARIRTLRDQAEKELADIEKRLPEIIIPDTTKAEADIRLYDTLTQKLRSMNGELTTANMLAAQAKHAHAVAEANYTKDYDNYQKTLQQIQEQQALLAKYNANNALIKKLRDARPIVARELWTLVLHGVSHYFTSIRGVASVVSRGDAGFVVDGRPATDLSGSTLDALGLAIRMALQKTFLPTLDFMMLDEPASGMDDNRETAMLGLLAASGYNQVMLVTHSPLADAFATQVVQV